MSVLRTLGARLVIVMTKSRDISKPKKHDGDGDGDDDDDDDDDDAVDDADNTVDLLMVMKMTVLMLM